MLHFIRLYCNFQWDSTLYTYVDEEDAESLEEVLLYFESLIKFMETIVDEADTQYTSEDIYEFAGVTVDKWKKIIKE